MSDVISRVVYAVDDATICIAGEEPVSDVFFGRDWLEDPEFDIPRWYQDHVAHVLGDRRCASLQRREPMYDALALEAQVILNGHVPYPELWTAWAGENVNLSVLSASIVLLLIMSLYGAYYLTTPHEDLENPNCDLPNEYARETQQMYLILRFDLDDLDGELAELFAVGSEVEVASLPDVDMIDVKALQLHAARIKTASLLALQHNAVAT